MTIMLFRNQSETFPANDDSCGDNDDDDSVIVV